MDLLSSALSSGPTLPFAELLGVATTPCDWEKEPSEERLHVVAGEAPLAPTAPEFNAAAPPGGLLTHDLCPHVCWHPLHHLCLPSL